MHSPWLQLEVVDFIVVHGAFKTAQQSTVGNREKYEDCLWTFQKFTSEVRLPTANDLGLMIIL